MKKFFLFFNFIPTIIFAQFAKVVDKDGFVNVRQKPDSKSKVLHKAVSGSILFIDNKGNDSEDWDYVTSADGKNSVEGYIHASRLVKIADLEEIPEAITENGCANFLLKNFEINVCTKDFTKEDRKNFSERNGHHYYKGVEFYSPNPPRNYYKKISGRIGNQNFEVPQRAFQGLFDVNLELTSCTFDPATQTLYIFSTNSDGSQAYEVVFIIKNGKFQKRLVAALD